MKYITVCRAILWMMHREMIAMERNFHKQVKYLNNKKMFVKYGNRFIRHAKRFDALYETHDILREYVAK